MVSAAQGQYDYSYPYVLHDLGNLGGTFSAGYAINNRGEVTGYYLTSDGLRRAFLSGPNGLGSARDLGALGAPNSYAFALNDSGQVVGESFNYVPPVGSTSPFYGFISEPNGGPLHDLGNLGGDMSPRGVNVSGQVTGSASLVPGPAYSPVHAFFVDTVNGGMLVDLGTLGGNSSSGYAINAHGQVVGGAELADGSYHAFISEPNGGALRDLGSLGGPSCSANAVNNSGQVTGISSINSGNIPQQAFISAPNGGALINIRSLRSNGFSEGEGINEAGEVVGESEDTSGLNLVPFFYSASGGMTNLDSMIHPGSGFVLKNASGINDYHQITGYGQSSNGEYHAYILTPKDFDALPVAIRSVTRSGSTFKITLQAFYGDSYLLQRSASIDPVSVQWAAVGTFVYPYFDELISITDPDVAAGAMYYRVWMVRGIYGQPANPAAPVAARQSRVGQKRGAGRGIH